MKILIINSIALFAIGAFLLGGNILLIVPVIIALIWGTFVIKSDKYCIETLKDGVEVRNQIIKEQNELIIQYERKTKEMVEMLKEVNRKKRKGLDIELFCDDPKIIEKMIKWN